MCAAGEQIGSVIGDGSTRASFQLQVRFKNGQFDNSYADHRVASIGGSERKALSGARIEYRPVVAHRRIGAGFQLQAGFKNRQFENRHVDYRVASIAGSEGEGLYIARVEYRPVVRGRRAGASFQFQAGFKDGQFVDRHMNRGVAAIGSCIRKALAGAWLQFGAVEQRSRACAGFQCHICFEGRQLVDGYLHYRVATVEGGDRKAPAFAGI